jgi:hypothetical protein
VYLVIWRDKTTVHETTDCSSTKVINERERSTHMDIWIHIGGIIQQYKIC